MKFGREYVATLEQEQYPQHWVQSSISYRQLKKCIRKIQSELSQLGLDASAIESLLRFTDTAEVEALPPAGTAAYKITEFKPKLVFLVRKDDGDLVDATLSPRTKETLQKLVDTGSLSGGGTDHEQFHLQPAQEGQGSDHSTSLQVSPCSVNVQDDPNLVRVEVPLRNNEEFFQILQHGLSELSALHSEEKTALGREIGSLGQMVSRVAKPAHGMQRTDLYAWRAVFSLYLESNVFFSTNENETFSRSPPEVQRQLQIFSNRLDSLQKNNKFRRKESSVALQRFLLVNANLLRNLKFQQLNIRAAGKILKSK
ncbi:MAG: hypothetical protein Q9182_006604 [Xanthomendoza sp. 2 TL-2023]